MSAFLCKHYRLSGIFCNNMNLLPTNGNELYINFENLSLLPKNFISINRKQHRKMFLKKIGHRVRSEMFGRRMKCFIVKSSVKSKRIIRQGKRARLDSCFFFIRKFFINFVFPPKKALKIVIEGFSSLHVIFMPQGVQKLCRHFSQYCVCGNALQALYSNKKKKKSARKPEFR